MNQQPTETIEEIFINRGEEEQHQQLEDLLEAAEEGNLNLIAILHQAQNIFGYLPRRVQVRIAERLEIPFSKVYSVVSFYSLFSTTKRGKYTIEVCTGTACYVKGSQDILDKINDELDIEPGQTSEDDRFTLQDTRCVGACGMAPVVIIGDDVHGRVKPEQLPELLRQYE
ncbi:NAD(P)H-dependent oxidoreductase subunit E [Natroniella sulfidigena]|uniref:NADH-quinone oxidoreductase subunit NuoE family protein n=1 Tax=Natroniella sulfidigena TaxID=723921 RepID=UPI00200A53D6|nr:NAD(P)H-dependent oxidoreductase subunit E [Natroniella sulfidigena]MCK8817922.1 NAD(P)H-dependent oxidoreductase subunit E [Natroniella sulfidigena]